MSTLGAVPNLSMEELRKEVKHEYTEVALDPDKGYHFLQKFSGIFALFFKKSDVRFHVAFFFVIEVKRRMPRRPYITHKNFRFGAGQALLKIAYDEFKRVFLS